ncbi:tetratricopeptide repeat protein [Paenibacillus rhizoplanae]
MKNWRYIWAGRSTIWAATGKRLNGSIRQWTRVKKDPLWHFRVGYAHYYLDEYDQAIKAFKRANKLDPEDQDTIEFLEWSRSEKAALAAADEDSEDGEEAAEADSASDASPDADSDAAKETKH